MNIQAKLNSAEQCSTLKRLTELPKWLGLEGESKNPAEFHLDESSGKALSTKHAYQVKLKDLMV